jgi:peroxiredoxin
LPAPVDDGGADHLAAQRLPDLAFPSTDGGEINLAQAAQALVLYVFPRIGRPGEADITGWDDVPGARGCTQQSCAFRDRLQEFSDLGYTVAGLSAQTLEDLAEAAQRLHLAFPLLADPARRLGEALDLPTFGIAGMTFYKRLTLVARNGRIIEAFYPVFPPDESPEAVLAWLRAAPRAG